jgi:HAD superfamily hydrolase (TIGR01549 family)
LVQAVIFDIDGTLVDSVDLHAKAWQEAFRHFNREIPFEQVRSQIGKGGDQLLPVFFTEQELQQFGKELEEFRGRLFKKEYLSQVRPFPKVRALFERLIQDGRRIVLASSAKEDELKVYKQIAQIEDLIQDDVSADNVEKSKPHPDVFEEALKKLKNVKVAEAVAIGDTPYDAQAAGKLSLRTIGLLCGGFPEPDLRAAGCIAIYQDPADLLARYQTSLLHPRAISAA